MTDLSHISTEALRAELARRTETISHEQRAEEMAEEAAERRRVEEASR